MFVFVTLGTKQVAVGKVLGGGAVRRWWLGGSTRHYRLGLGILDALDFDIQIYEIYIDEQHFPALFEPVVFFSAKLLTTLQN